MNLQQLRYAVEIEKTNSISAAARNLYMGQPNLSRSLKELEQELGTTLFRRTARGMEPTPNGLEFLNCARGILQQVDELQTLYHPAKTTSIRFSLTATHTTYLSLAFSQFISQCPPDSGMNIFFREANCYEVFNDVVMGQVQLGIFRYHPENESYFHNLVVQNHLSTQLVREFSTMLLMDRSHPLAQSKSISLEMLQPYTQLLHRETPLPALSSSSLNQDLAVGKRHIYICDRGSQFDLLRSVPGSYLWVAPLPTQELERQNLVQLPCVDSNVHRDVAIWRTVHGLPTMGKDFLDYLENFLQA